LLTPIVHFEKGVERDEDYDKYCKEDCNACTQACPTGAIAPMSLPDKLLRPIGLAQVDMPGCLLTHGQQCSVCVYGVCPRYAINTKDLNGFDQEIVVDAGKCNGCGACVLVCPAKVIEVVPNGRYDIAAVDPTALHSDF
jgi:ferredoxin